ncbi:hypothetical protein AB0395_45665 [Streptosporangium sp. NPDC051023]|uniref:hypothetical protein n=1 Tax=Streptosporangium sp. NPDC051023 TaxID=3155410 RepID=UPI00344E67DA
MSGPGFGANQLALFAPKPPRSLKAPTAWAVELNEIHLAFYAPDTVTWWQPYRVRFERSGKVRILHATIPGEVILIGPYDDRNDAEFLRDRLLAEGAPKTSAKVCRWPSEEAS